MEVEDYSVVVAQDVYQAGGQIRLRSPTWAFRRWAGFGKYKADKRETLQTNVVG